MNAHRPSRRRTAGLLAAMAAALCLAPLAFGQQLTGNIYATAVDEQGGRLPGVTVTLTGVGAPRTQTTDARGEARFVNLSPGLYTLVYELQSFSRVTNTDVKVSVGQNTETHSDFMWRGGTLISRSRMRPSVTASRWSQMALMCQPSTYRVAGSTTRQACCTY